MSFTRTNSGISNLRLFYDVDIVIYTEGGVDSFSIEDVENGKYNKQSVDIKFWSHVLEINGFTKKVEFRAIGSKTASRSICEKIINNEVKNVAVAIDRDLDQYLGGLFDSPLILYTKGYSWENDVFIKELTLAQIESMIFSGNIPKDIKDSVDATYEDFGSCAKYLAKLELIFRFCGVRFISDINGERFLNVKDGVFIDRKQIGQVLSEKKKSIVRPVKTGIDMGGLCPVLNNYGKLLEALSFAVINYVCKRYAGYKSIPKQLVAAAMIERFAQKIRAEKDDYYYDIVEKLKSA